MKFDDTIKEKIESILRTTPLFNDPYVKKIRDLKTFYGYKINLVLTGNWAYPCSGCQLPRREMISNGNNQFFEETADEHCCSCSEPMDVKYMSIPQLETYVNHRSKEFKEKDLKRHPENLPLHSILNYLPIEEKQMEKAITSIG